MIHNHQQFDLLGKMIFQRVIFTPPIRLKDSLESEACLLYSVSGNSSLYHGDQKYSLQSDSGIFMTCGNYFNHWKHNLDGSKNEAVAIHLYPEVIEHIYRNELPEFLVAKGNRRTKDLQLIQNDAYLQPYIQSLLGYFNNPSLVDDEIIALKIKELLNLLYKLDHQNIRLLLSEMFSPSHFDFRNTVLKNMYEDISLEELAHVCHMSLSSFKRRFNEQFGDSPASFIRKKRCEKAAELLAASKKRITDISFECGFSNSDIFTKSFKKLYGKTPSEFRKLA